MEGFIHRALATHALRPIEMRARRKIGMPHAGLTLIELIATLVVLGVLAAAAAPTLSSGVRAYDATHASLLTLNKLRYATERMVREVREVRRDPSDPSMYDIGIMTATSFRFTKSDGVEVTIDRPAQVRLTYSTPPITPAPTLTDQVDMIEFKYFKADGTTETASKSEVAFVQISLSLKHGTAVYAQRVRVGLRNQV